MTPPDSAGGDARQLESAAQALGLALSADQIDRLLRYRDGLLRWNKVYNLTAVRDPQMALRQHVIDCLAVVPAFRRALAAQGEGTVVGQGAAREVLDVGSGGGLPGLILAVAEPRWRIDCLDAVGKKVAFIRQMAAELGLGGVRAVHSRIEDWVSGATAPRYAVVTSRAFSSLADFTQLTRPALGRGGVWLAMKGQTPDEEQALLPADIDVFHVEPLQVPGSDQQRCLVWMRPNDGRAIPEKDATT